MLYNRVTVSRLACIRVLERERELLVVVGYLAVAAATTQREKER